jgi:hypothetical protein
MAKKREEPEGVTGPSPTPFFKAPLYYGAGFDESGQNRCCHNGSAGGSSLVFRAFLFRMLGERKPNQAMQRTAPRSDA